MKTVEYPCLGQTPIAAGVARMWLRERPVGEPRPGELRFVAVSCRPHALTQRLAGVFRSAFMGALVMLLAGCTFTTKVRVTPEARISNPSGTKVPMHVALMLRGPYTEYAHSVSRMGDTWVTPLGPALRQTAVSLCEQTFRQVTVSTNGVVPAGVDGVLTPDVHRAASARGTSGKLMFTVLVEWTLRDANNEKTLWVATADGQGADREKRVFQKLFDDLVTKSHTAFVTSPEIKRLTEGAR